jgi:hypothetical protein
VKGPYTSSNYHSIDNFKKKTKEYEPFVQQSLPCTNIRLFQDKQVLDLNLKLIGWGCCLLSSLAPGDICQVQAMLELVCGNMLHQYVRCILKSVDLLK